jgi:predicted permease
MDKRIIVTQVTTLFLIMAIGFIARKAKILNPESTKGLMALLVNITAPLTALTAFQFDFSKQMLDEAGVVLFFSIAVHLFSILLSKVLFFRMPDVTGRVLRFATVFSNCAFMGYPVIGGFFGPRGVFLTAIYVAVFNIFAWTYGVFIFTSKADRDSLKHALLNPGVISVVLGMLMFLFSIKLPRPLAQTFELVGGMTTPISMLIIGSLLAELKFTELFSGLAVYYGSMVRLLVIPLLSLSCLRFFGIKGIVLGVCVLAVAMPAATLTAPLADQNGGDARFASRVVFLSTIFSMVTIPVVLWMV